MKNSTRILGLIVWLALPLAAGLVGSQFMPGEWYAALNKPSWNPPNWIFGPVWTTLYAMMGIAAWLVWLRKEQQGAQFALILFVLHLALNALWSYLFFGAQRPDLAFYEIVVLWLAIVGVLIWFWRIDRRAGALLVPYLLWVSFAACLNFALWRMNIGA